MVKKRESCDQYLETLCDWCDSIQIWNLHVKPRKTKKLRFLECIGTGFLKIMTLMQSKRDIFFYKINIYYSEPRTVDEKKDTSNWKRCCMFWLFTRVFLHFPIVIHSRNDNIENWHILYITINGYTIFIFGITYLSFQIYKFIYNNTA